jgi:hypothetical protein
MQKGVYDMDKKFTFGTQVRRVGSQERFVVLGTEKNGMIQIAAFNHKTAAKPEALERA